MDKYELTTLWQNTLGLKNRVSSSVFQFLVSKTM